MKISAPEYDVVIWGATGFTGKLACEYMARTYGLPSDACRYAIAARTESRLDAVERAMIDTAKLHNKTNSKNSVPKILATIEDQSSIDKMVQQAKAVLAFAGPYNLFGEAVVKSCVENKTHYVDCTGEMDFVNRMRNKYNEMAKTNNVKIVVACGLGFMPADMSMYFANEQCKANQLTMTSVTMDVHIVSNGPSGGTLRTYAEMVKNIPLAEFGSRFYPPYADCEEMPSEEVVNANRCKPWSVRYNSEAEQFASYSIYSTAVSNWIRRSNEMQDFMWGNNLVVQVAHLTPSVFRGVLQIFLTILLQAVAVLLSRVTWLLPFPEAGKATFDPSNSQKGKHCNLYLSVVGKDQTDSTKTLTCQFHAPYDAYHLTALSVVEAGLSVSKNQNPTTYGVMGPSAALGTPYLGRLREQNINVKLTRAPKRKS